MAAISKYKFIGQLFRELEQNGFSLRIDDYNDALTLLLETPDGDMEALKYRLASIISVTATQQQEFYVIYDKTLQSPKIEATENCFKCYIRKAISAIGKHPRYIVIAALVLVLSYFVLLPPKSVAYDKAFDMTSQSSSFYFTTRKFFTANPKLNEKDFAIQWTIDDSIKVNKIAFNYHPDKFKKHEVKLHLQSRLNAIDTTISKNIFPHARMRFWYGKTLADRYKKINTETAWKTRDTIFFAVESDTAWQHKTVLIYKSFKAIQSRQTTTTPVLETYDLVLAQGKKARSTYFIPKKAGTYRFYGLVQQKFPLENDSAFIYSQTVVLRVKEKIGLSVTETAKPPMREIESSWLAAIALLCFLLTFALYYFLQKMLKEKPLEYKVKEDVAIKEKSIRLLEQFGGDELPDDLEWKNKNGQINKDSFLANWNKGLIQNIQTERTEINISGTIRKTMNNLGIISPVLEKKSKQKRYIILLHKKFSRDAQFSLFNYLIGHLYGNHIPVDVYHFNNRFVITDKNGEVVSFSDLTNYSQQNSLMIFSDGHFLIDYQMDVVDHAFKNLLADWQNKILITPMAFLDWAAEERILAKSIPIVPADITGLLDIVKILNDESGFNNYEFYQTSRFNLSDVNELENFLSDDVLMQWVCALAAYPKIYWELIISIGHHLFPSKINYANLLQLSRISWLHNGEFPQALRLELLKRLDSNTEIKVRKHLLDLLEKEVSGIDASQVAFEEREIQKYTNSFILFASDDQDIPKEALRENAENFMALHEGKKITDRALKTYLENREDKWETPIDGEIGVVQYIENYYTKQNEIKIGKEKWKLEGHHVWIGFVTFVFTLALFLIVQKIPWGYDQTFFTRDINNPQKTFLIKNNDCYSKFSKEGFYAMFRNFSNNDSLTIYIEKPSDSAINDSLNELTVTGLKENELYQVWFYNKTNNPKKDSIGFNGEFRAKSNTNYNIEMNCGTTLSDPPEPEPAKDSIIIQYNERAQKSTAEMLASRLRSIGYFVTVPIGELNLEGDNELRYYDLGKKQLALKIKKSADSIMQSTGNPVAFKLQKYQLSLPEKKTNIFKIWIKKTSVTYESNIRTVGVNIRYKPLQLQGKVALFSKNLPNKIFNTASVATFESAEQKSMVVYTQDKYTAAAKELARLASSYFKLDIKAIKGDRLISNDLTLWISESEIKNPVAEPNSATPAVAVPGCISKKMSQGNYVMYYNSNSSGVDNSTANVMKDIALEAKQFPDYAIELISGNTLVSKQAASFKSYLVKNGIASNRIKSLNSQPALSNSGNVTRNNCANKLEVRIVSNEPPVSAKSVLWLDDSPEINESAVNSLRKQGVTVDLVYTNAQAYAAVAKNSYNFIITDIDRQRTEEGVKDRYTAGLDFIRKVSFNKGNIIVKTNADNQAYYQNQLKRLGVHNIITNNYDIEEFILQGF